ncbi:monovalent cation:proton antiporter-2 (CPA2) family protein [Riemerella anatipestifer]|uniref:monovalent cation:proton antiporter-2 (CPA2) family protein n=1 Tax=Riemerella anatipestifer TaxID=34085 RepID=UPI002363BDD8|nr:monovalent cation:proton antiporter-2 (CPA2) family protein [Riemerella anatipestifer]MDD1539119.1 potassium transporter [Riemerella anatipestifer]
MSESLFKITLVYLGAAIFLVPIVRKFGFSSVIGYILGGILVGPFALKLTGNAEDVMHSTEFGVVMLLFIIGLELEPRKFWAMRKSILGLGFSQMAFTFGLIFPILHLAGWEVTTNIVVSIAFAMSSTAIVLQTLKEKNLFNTVSGEASFSTLLFQDIAVIPILALLPMLAGQSEGGGEKSVLITYLPEWLQPFSVILGVGVLILLGRYLFVPFLRYVSRSGMNELLTASSLFLVVGVSELMLLAGLSPALGAFLAGVMLANTEFRHELESQIDPFKGLLLAVFFVSVGSTINFNVIQQDPLFIFSMVVMATLVKFGVLFLVGKMFKMSNDQNFLYSFGMSQVGEFAFVIITFAVKLNLLDLEISSQMISVVAISMMITPFLLLLNERVIAPNFNVKFEEPVSDLISEPIKQKKIIIVGFGHFGSTVGRLLKVSGIKATVLDNDSNRVNLLRQKGFKVYYGDAKRVEIMRAAGAENAEILVLCLDDPESNKYMIQMAKSHFPHLQIFVRARNRLDAYDFINDGIHNIYRETLETAVNMGVDILNASGFRKYAARRLANRFIAIDNDSTIRLAKQDIDSDTTFTIKESLEREARLLADDNISFEDEHWLDEDEEVEEEKS